MNTGPARFGTRNAIIVRPMRIKQDPLAQFCLSLEASQEDKLLCEKLLKEIIDKNAVYCLNQLANQSWWNQQSTLTFQKDKDQRMIELLKSTLLKHQQNYDNNSTPELIVAINYMIELKACNYFPKLKNSKNISCLLSTSDDPVISALNKFKCNLSLVTPNMRDEALAAYKQMKENEGKEKEEQAKARMAKAKLKEATFEAMKQNGW